MLEQIFMHQKAFALQLRKESLEVRLEHLDTLEQIISQNQQAFCEALAKDFSKPEAESLLTEIYPLIHEIQFAKKNLKKWMKPQKTSTPLLMKGAKCAIQQEPRGVCLLISPWNYPLLLTFGPLISAVAAGNTVVIKPSEFTSHVSSLMAKLLKEKFKDEHIAVVLGGHETSTELLKFPFDHIFFTGSTHVGRIVMAAAAKNLSSVTLELGGKSPTIVDNTADLELAADKILWGKFINAGQTCVAPDYLFVQNTVHHRFIKILKAKLDATYGKSAEERKSSKDFARIINTHHTKRLKGLLEEALAHNAGFIYGGEVDVADRYVAPTLIENVDVHMGLMKEEIFGPILPIQTFKDMSEVVHFINERPKPLTLYMYSHSDMHIEQIAKETSSGALSINDSVIYMANPYLPFGGVGESGMGASHGYHGFKEFSHGKAIFKQSWTGKFLKMVYPPYNQKKIDLLKSAIRFKV
ncbi:MAG: aldehyde dehydrogenase family protein [Bdellovibrio sp.]|nr:aldehyde dehydrogenase family protein [Bdellovibrio sp.]